MAKCCSYNNIVYCILRHHGREIAMSERSETAKLTVKTEIPRVVLLSCTVVVPGSGIVKTGDAR